MGLDIALHNFIEKYNVVKKPTEQVHRYLSQHPPLHKVALLVNHVFRALAMTAFCSLLPFSAPMSTALCFAGSLFYRLTVETHCTYKFALPAFAGSIAIPMATKALTPLVTGIALGSLHTLGLSFLPLIPLVAYVTYITLTVNYDVDHRR